MINDEWEEAQRRITPLTINPDTKRFTGRQAYDLVLHLESLACANMSQGYSTQTDATATVRIEDQSRARESDFKLRDIYSVLDNWRFVPTTPNLDNKTSNCKDHINAIMHHVTRQVRRASECEGSDLPDRERHDDDDDQDED
eukprot:876493-Rhodomonas_salina.2